MSVIYEVGQFQGCIGVTKAIVPLEEGCEEFSNIQGLGQIRFLRNNVAACFEEVRKVIECEGLVKAYGYSALEFMIGINYPDFR